MNTEIEKNNPNNDVSSNDKCEVIASMEVTELEQRYEYGDVYICNYTIIL